MILLYHMIWFVMSEFWSKNCSRPMMAMAYESPDLYSINNMIGALANTPKWKEAVATSRRWWAMKKTPPPEKSLVVWWICWDMLICWDFTEIIGNYDNLFDISSQDMSDWSSRIQIQRLIWLFAKLLQFWDTWVFSNVRGVLCLKRTRGFTYGCDENVRIFSGQPIVTTQKIERPYFGGSIVLFNSHEQIVTTVDFWDFPGTASETHTFWATKFGRRLCMEYMKC